MKQGIVKTKSQSTVLLGIIIVKQRTKSTVSDAKASKSEVCCKKNSVVFAWMTQSNYKQNHVVAVIILDLCLKLIYN